MSRAFSPSVHYITAFDLTRYDALPWSSIISVDSDPNRAMPAAPEDSPRIFPPMIMSIGIAFVLAGCLARRMAPAPVHPISTFECAIPSPQCGMTIILEQLDKIGSYIPYSVQFTVSFGPWIAGQSRDTVLLRPSTFIHPSTTSVRFDPSCPVAKDLDDVLETPDSFHEID